MWQKSFKVRGWKRYHCMDCGCIYRSRFERLGVGVGETPSKANDAAMEYAVSPLTEDREMLGCPECGIIPRVVVCNVLNDAYWKPVKIGALGALVIIVLGATKVIDLQSSALVMAFWLLVVGAWEWNIAHRKPNRDPEANQADSASLLKLGRMQILRRGNPDFSKPSSLNFFPILAWILWLLSIVISLLPPIVFELSGWWLKEFWWLCIIGSPLMMLAMVFCLAVHAEGLASRTAPALVETLDGEEGEAIVVLPDLPDTDGVDENRLMIERATSTRDQTPVVADPESWGRVWVGAIATLICVGVVIWQWPWAAQVLQGPVRMTEAELVKIDGQPNLPNGYFTYQYDQALDTGFGIKKGSTWKSRYLLVKVQDRWALTSVPANHTGNKLTGYLSSIGGWDEEVLGQVRGQFAGNKLTSFTFDAREDQQGQVWAFISVMLVLILGGAGLCYWGASSLWRARGTPAIETSAAPPPTKNDMPDEEPFWSPDEKS